MIGPITATTISLIDCGSQQATKKAEAMEEVRRIFINQLAACAGWLTFLAACWLRSLLACFCFTTSQ